MPTATLSSADFPAFFQALWGFQPFPWQQMLVERLLDARPEQRWPRSLELPTASGKTACLDAALFALACQADLPAEARTSPRRIWFVVDRRIVVDEAYQRAKEIAEKLAEAGGDGILKRVAEALRKLSGTGHPLVVGRLRGGVVRPARAVWSYSPAQPAIICSTVDQLGSQLLFRGYRYSRSTAPIWAGLAANDSAIFLDEAHCAVPFMQTLEALRRYRSADWAELPLNAPFHFCAFSATLPTGRADDPGRRFPSSAEDRVRALTHPVLDQRFNASKPARLKELAGIRGGADALVLEAVAQAQTAAESGSFSRLAVMVNRVATAEAIAKQLRKALGAKAEIVLMTGRMRPYDNRLLLEKYVKTLKAGSQVELKRPVVVVTTQCLEVGADFSFDALITECASLSALRQRFGRLNRLGTFEVTDALILIRANDAKGKEEDPIYGKALPETWKWLLSLGGAAAVVDFGVRAMDAHLAAAPDRQVLEAPAVDAPILLPAHLDLLCQTSPAPRPDVEIALFLHGKNAKSEPEVRVLWRADLLGSQLKIYSQNQTDASAWVDTISLFPPMAEEMLTVPLNRLRRWLTKQSSEVGEADVEGFTEIVTDEDTQTRPPKNASAPFLIWRGREGKESSASDRLNAILDGDIVVLPLEHYDLEGLAQGAAARELDLVEALFPTARGEYALRVQPAILGAWAEHPRIAPLLRLAATPDRQPEEIYEALNVPPPAEAPALPDWLEDALNAFAKLKINDLRGCILALPDSTGDRSGFILIGGKAEGAVLEPEPFADQDDQTSATHLNKGVRLDEHLAQVRDTAEGFAKLCVQEFAQVFQAAGQAHDLGKLDRRFQLMLRGGDEAALELADLEEGWLAKSAKLAKTRTLRQALEEHPRQELALPPGFRHEFLSAQIAQWRPGLLPAGEAERELTLHLIEAHHGQARPFAPVALDEKPAEVNLHLVSEDLVLDAEARKVLSPPENLASGVAERFWRLNRRYGWWGLAYLEGILRLADWEASRRPYDFKGESPKLEWSVSPPVSAAASSAPPLPLGALDGANPLAYLAALGTLRLLSQAWPEREIRLGWEQRAGAWRPILHAQTALDPEEVLGTLLERGLNLDLMFGPFRNEKTLGFSEEDYRRFVAGAAEHARWDLRTLADFAAVWAWEIANPKAKEKNARKSKFDFTAGQQQFIGMIRDLRASCSVEALRATLFDGWNYTPGATSMRWDPLDEKRQYAVQAFDPTNASKNPGIADLGANFLAVEGLSCFPMVPTRFGDQLGFGDTREGRVRSYHWRWPIWSGLASVAVAKAVIAAVSHAGGSEAVVPCHQIYESQIVQPSGRYRCFTPARSA